jgi:glutamyl-tRNA reductase
MILDLAVPRDFEPSIGDCLGVYLYTVDDLKKVCRIHVRQREKELPRAKRIIERETQRFMIDLQLDSASDTIKQLKINARQLQELELERLINKLPDLAPHQKEAIDQSFQRLANKLLHPPLESLRNEPRGEAGLLVALRRLFQIND